MTQVELGTDILKKQAAKEQTMLERYKDYDPTVRDITRYLKNIVIDNNGSKKYQPLIGDAPTAITVAIAFIIGNSPVLLKSFAGAGKTVIMQAILSLIPKDYYMEIEAGSGVAMWNQVDDINSHKYLVFPELQKAAGNPEVNEVLKTLGEFRSAHRNVTDVTMGGADGDRVRERVIDWKPFLTSVAVENERGAKIFDAELSRRMIDVYTDVSETATSLVIQNQLETFEKGVNAMLTMSEDEIEMLKFHIQQVLTFRDQFIKEYRFPGATAIHGQIPAKFVQSRSATPLLIRMISAFAAFNYKNRIITEDGVLLVTPEDVYLAWQTYGPRFLQKCMNMDIMAEEILSVFKKVDNLAEVGIGHMMNEHEIKSKLAEAKVNVGKKKLRDLLESFVEHGILDTHIDSMTDNKEVLYHKTGIDDMDSNIKYQEMIEHCKEVVRKEYPDYADEYIERFCDKPIVQHPLKPVTMNLLTGVQSGVAE